MNFSPTSEQILRWQWYCGDNEKILNSCETAKTASDLQLFRFFLNNCRSAIEAKHWCLIHENTNRSTLAGERIMSGDCTATLFF